MFAIFFALSFLFNSFYLSFSIFLNCKSHSFRSKHSFLYHSSVHAVGTNEEKLGIVIIDHGSKMNEANENLEKVNYFIPNWENCGIVSNFLIQNKNNTEIPTQFIIFVNYRLFLCIKSHRLIVVASLKLRIWKSWNLALPLHFDVV